jgi:hypothetical protein
VTERGEDEPTTPMGTGHDRRWPASLAVLVAITTQAFVPPELTAGPRWLLPALAVALLVPLVLANPLVLRRDVPVLRQVAIGLVALLIAANGVHVARLVVNLTTADAGIKGAALVRAALSLLVVNIVAFAVLYWEIDRGGPFARHPDHPPAESRPDLLFPQMQDGVPGWPAERWLPSFGDYLFVAFTSATAFSPTDTLPLSIRAKTFMMIEAVTSLVTIGVVAARAVNIL